LYVNATGDQNTAVGKNSLYNNVSGDNNTAVGFSALDNNNSGINNTALGAESAFFSGALNNTTCLGYQAGNNGNASNRVSIGNTSVTWIGGQVTWSTYSDERIKENVEENVPGLAFISRLRPVTYNLNIHKQNEMFKKEGKESSDWPEKYDIEKIRMTGFLAQEVEKAARDAGYDFSGIEAPENNGLYSLRYSDFVVPLVKAVQEQQKMIAEMQQKNEELQKQIDELKAILKK